MEKRRLNDRIAIVLLLLLVGGAFLLGGAFQPAPAQAIPIIIDPPIFHLGPAVESYYPLSGAVDVSVDTTVRVKFDSNMDATTINDSTFYLETRSPLFPLIWMKVPASITYLPFSDTAVLTPASALTPGKTYRATLTADIKSELGWTLKDTPIVWTFTTAALPTPPEVTTRVPNDGATGIPVTQTVSISFDKDMNASTITTASFYLEERSLLLIWPPIYNKITASVSYDAATHTATLYPASNLATSRTYRATLTTAVKGANGLSVSGAPIVWSFTTASDTPPVVTGRTPAVGATGRPLDQVVTVSFDKDMNASTITTASFYLTQSGGGVVPATVAYDTPTRTAILTPSSPLLPEKSYTVTLTTAVKGTNGLSVQDAPIVWGFSTMLDKPVITTRIPVNGAIDRPLDQTVSVTFDRAMDSTTITSATFYIYKAGGSPLPSSITYDAVTRTAHLTPLADLLPDSTYVVTLTTSVKGATGQSVEGAPVVWAFTTMAAETAFSDVTPGVTPYAAAIIRLANARIINGFSDNTYRPNYLVTRQQFAKMIVLTLQLEVPPGIVCPFSDVDLTPNPVDPLYPAKYVAVCALHGITTGKTATTFDPYSNISRFQVISMVVRGIDGASPGLLAQPPAGFAATWDPASSAQHGQNARRAEYNGLLAGLPLAGLNPFGSMPRGEVAQILSNALDLLVP